MTACPKCGFPMHVVTATKLGCDRCHTTVDTAHVVKPQTNDPPPDKWKCEACGSLGNASVAVCRKCGRWIANCCSVRTMSGAYECAVISKGCKP